MGVEGGDYKSDSLKHLLDQTFLIYNQVCLLIWENLASNPEHRNILIYSRVLLNLNANARETYSG